MSKNYDVFNESFITEGCLYNYVKKKDTELWVITVYKICIEADCVSQFFILSSNTWDNHLREKKDYFGSELWRCQSMVSGPVAFGLHWGRTWWRKLLTYVIGKEKERERRVWDPSILFRSMPCYEALKVLPPSKSAMKLGTKSATHGPLEGIWDPNTNTEEVGFWWWNYHHLIFFFIVFYIMVHVLLQVLDIQTQSTWADRRIYWLRNQKL